MNNNDKKATAPDQMTTVRDTSESIALTDVHAVMQVAREVGGMTAAGYVGKKVVDAAVDVAKHAAIKAIDARAARKEAPPTIYGADGRVVRAKDRK
jgi:hypothetical protein